MFTIANEIEKFKPGVPLVMTQFGNEMTGSLKNFAPRIFKEAAGGENPFLEEIYEYLPLQKLARVAVAIVGEPSGLPQFSVHVFFACGSAEPSPTFARICGHVEQPATDTTPSRPTLLGMARKLLNEAALRSK